MLQNELKDFLDQKLRDFRTSTFIEDDPISIPHRFSLRQDIEIAGFFAALFAWGRRSQAIKKASLLLSFMDNDPYQFIMQHKESDLKRFLKFVHRTFNPTDVLYFIDFFHRFYQKHNSLEEAFCPEDVAEQETVEASLNFFYRLIFSGENYPQRTKKHISAPFKKSASKRLNMFLRWMVREDEQKIDFGLWKKIQPAQLVIPIDVHVCRVATRLELIPKKNHINWRTAIRLTEKLRELDPVDPVKYDYALFGLGAIEKYK